MSGPGSPVFLDSSGYLALVSARDARHQEARVAWTQLTEEHWRTLTTNFVIAETHALFLARLSWSHAAAFLRQFARSTTTIARVEPADERRAFEIIFQYEDKAWSLTDATSFAVMERLQIMHAFTFDRDFSRYGFIPVARLQR